MTRTLPHLRRFAVLRLTGADRLALLQGQASNDARRVVVGTAQLTSFNDPKGRCLAVAVLAAREDEHLLVTEASVAEALCKRLAMYILRSAARVSLATDLAVCARWGTDAAPWSSQTEDEGLVVTLPGERALVITTADRVTDAPDGEPAWARADHALGLAWVTATTSGRCVPLWLGLERLGAIDYAKGCYTGQEIVARTHYLGRQKQSLHRAVAAAALAPGTEVRTAADRDAGLVLASAALPEGDHGLLLCLRDELAQEGLQCAGQALSGVTRVG